MILGGFSFVRRKVRCYHRFSTCCLRAFRRLTTIGSTPASPFEASLTMKETRDYLRQCFSFFLFSLLFRSYSLFFLPFFSLPRTLSCVYVRLLYFSTGNRSQTTQVVVRDSPVYADTGERFFASHARRRVKVQRSVRADKRNRSFIFGGISRLSPRLLRDAIYDTRTHTLDELLNHRRLYKLTFSPSLSPSHPRSHSRSLSLSLFLSG